MTDLIAQLDELTRAFADVQTADGRRLRETPDGQRLFAMLANVRRLAQSLQEHH